MNEDRRNDLAQWGRDRAAELAMDKVADPKPHLPPTESMIERQKAWEAQAVAYRMKTAAYTTRPAED